MDHLNQHMQPCETLPVAAACVSCHNECVMSSCDSTRRPPPTFSTSSQRCIHPVGFGRTTLALLLKLCVLWINFNVSFSLFIWNISVRQKEILWLPVQHLQRQSSNISFWKETLSSLRLSSAELSLWHVARRKTLCLHYLLVELPSILVQLRQRLVTVLEELRLGLHQRQHLMRRHWITQLARQHGHLNWIKSRLTAITMSVFFLASMTLIWNRGKLGFVSVSTEQQKILAGWRHNRKCGGVKRPRAQLETNESECVLSRAHVVA